MNNIYIDCIHCGYLRLSEDETRRYSLRSALMGVICKNCNEESRLLRLLSPLTMWSKTTEVKFEEITTQELFNILKRERV